MCEILCNPLDSTQRKYRAENVRHRAMLWLASSKCRPQWRPGPESDTCDRGPARWFTIWEIGQACGCDSRSDWQTLGRLLEKMCKCGWRGRVPSVGLIERREAESGGEWEYRRTW